MSRLKAIGFAIAGFTSWVLCDSAIKLAGTSQLSTFEIVAFLGVFIALFVSAYWVIRHPIRELWPKRPVRLVGRGLLDVGNNLFVVVALRHLSLTLFYILVFTSPIAIAILGRVFLKERLDLRKAVAILVGFAGVVIAVDPFRSGMKGDWKGYGACAVCVSCFSAAMVWSRSISRSERAESVVLFSGLVSAAVGLIGMLWDAVPVNARMFGLLMLMGFLCALGSICSFLAVKYADAATTSQFHYTQLVSGAAVAYLLFHEVPTSSMLIGALLIVASGLYVALRGAHEIQGSNGIRG